MDALDISYDHSKDYLHLSTTGLLDALVAPKEALHVINLCWWNQIAQDLDCEAHHSHQHTPTQQTKGRAMGGCVAAYAKGIEFYKGIRNGLSELAFSFPSSDELYEYFKRTRCNGLYVRGDEPETDTDEFWSLESLLTEPSLIFSSQRNRALDFLVCVRVLLGALEEGIVDMVALLHSKLSVQGINHGDFVYGVVELQESFAANNICDEVFGEWQQRCTEPGQRDVSSLGLLTSIDHLSTRATHLLHHSLQIREQVSGSVFSFITRVTRTELIFSLAVISMPHSAMHSIFVLLGVKNSLALSKLSSNPIAKPQPGVPEQPPPNTSIVSLPKSTPNILAEAAPNSGQQEECKWAKLAMYTQPPAETTKNKNLNPCPKVVLHAPREYAASNFYVQVSLVRDDTANKALFLEGISRYRITPDGTVEFKRLKIKATCHQTRCSFFRLRFQLYAERGDSSELLERVFVTSEPVRVYAHSSQLTHLPLALLRVHRVIPETASGETREIVVVGTHFDGGTALVRVDGFDCTVVQGRIGWMRVAVPPGAFLWADKQRVTLYVSVDQGASFAAVCDIPISPAMPQPPSQPPSLSPSYHSPASNPGAPASSTRPFCLRV